MATWEEIRDEVAGMLADGQPLEDVIGKLEQRKNEMNNPKPNDANSPCEYCGCNPKNGGSGLCNCTLACPKIT